mmetsp:Transcript_22632/g.64227  ORF Transcript_22632/g.64227 Transcript_22632/m.64227 type:complete len:125 (-) Transcript_22632:1711-2085(-)
MRRVTYVSKDPLKGTSPVVRSPCTPRTWTCSVPRPGAAPSGFSPDAGKASARDLLLRLLLELPLLLLLLLLELLRLLLELLRWQAVAAARRRLLPLPLLWPPMLPVPAWHLAFHSLEASQRMGL